MKNNIEHAMFIPGRIQPKDEESFSRLYVGSEFCERQLPSVKILRERYVWTQGHNKNFTFVTPFVTNAGLEHLGKLFRCLSGTKGPVEVVFNDWGVFWTLRKYYPALVPVMGRLLTRQRRDPRIPDIMEGRQAQSVTDADGRRVWQVPKAIPRALSRYYQNSAVNVQAFHQLTSFYGIKRVEVDDLLWDEQYVLPRDLALSVYTPYGYISTGRECRHVRGKGRLCRKECSAQVFRLEDPDLPVPVMLAGATLFYQKSDLALQKWFALKEARSRIVHEPMLPM